MLRKILSVLALTAIFAACSSTPAGTSANGTWDGTFTTGASNAFYTRLSITDANSVLGGSAYQCTDATFASCGTPLATISGTRTNASASIVLTPTGSGTAINMTANVTATTLSGSWTGGGTGSTPGTFTLTKK